MIPNKYPYLKLHTLSMNTQSIECFDWSSLLAMPPKRGENRILPDYDGREIRPRKLEELRAALSIRIRGDYSIMNEHIPGSEDVWHTNLYWYFNVVKAICENEDPVDLELFFKDGTKLETSCIIEELSPLNFRNPYIATTVIDVTVPDGSLDLIAPPPPGGGVT